MSHAILDTRHRTAAFTIRAVGTSTRASVTFPRRPTIFWRGSRSSGSICSHSRPSRRRAEACSSRSFPRSRRLCSRRRGRRTCRLRVQHHALLVQGDDELGALATQVHERLIDAGVDVYASSGVTNGSGASVGHLHPGGPVSAGGRGARLVTSYVRPTTIDAALEYLNVPFATVLVGGTKADSAEASILVELQALQLDPRRTYTRDEPAGGRFGDAAAARRRASSAEGGARRGAARAAKTRCVTSPTVGACVTAAAADSELYATLLSRRGRAQRAGWGACARGRHAACAVRFCHLGGDRKPGRGVCCGAHRPKVPTGRSSPRWRGARAAASSGWR